MARRKLSSEINVVPYIDVMLVLLIIFMVTAPLLTQGINIDLPDANAASMTSQEEDVTLAIDPKGDYRLQGMGHDSDVLSDEQLEQQVTALIHAKPDKMILVSGDKKVPYERVAQALALLQTAGARKIGFLTEPTDAAAKPDDKKKP
jgi:biopolymer transport protein TolR